ncbi:hypothetical protein AABB24_001710 [Solanum stoloniferum]|uniref:Glabrous enhancer-binding protein-like DBD domain-containing protein n=1 Tax=Solanum stoloniferum TaxID=62892 RepID=A0ABD2VMR6_9SOLN
MDSVPNRHHQASYENLDYEVDMDLEGDEDSTSSPSIAGEVTIAVAGVSTGDSGAGMMNPGKRPRIDDFAIPVILPGAVKKPSAAFDESRKLFQRLWTDEDEIELLRGFLEYTTQRGLNTSSPQHHYDTTAFYEQIKSKFQLDFNKNQLVEKLRRLKKKYRTVVSKMGSGKDFVFKSAHDQVTFDISHRIWSTGGSYARSSPGGSVGFSAPPLEDGGVGLGLEDDEDVNPNPDSIVLYHSPKFNLNSNPNGIAIKTPRSQKRSPVPLEAVKVEHQPYQPPGVRINVQMPATNSNPVAAAPAAPPVSGVAAPQVSGVAAPPVAGVAASAPTTVAASVPNLIEETVRNCVSPIFKELVNNVANLNGSARGFGFGFGGAMSMEMMGDEKWRKQQMLELEVYSKRLELVQDQVKAQLEELRSMGSNN